MKSISKNSNTYLTRTLLLLVLLFIGFAVGCNSEDDTPTNTDSTNTDTSGDTGNDDTGNDTGNDDPVIVDPDGDGIDSDVEVDQGTDPEDGCSFLVESIDFTITTEEWRDSDCDGDGLSNGLELDPDGNDVDDGNGTDPLDPCSLDYSILDLEPNADWLELDCDGDGVSNIIEQNEGTDPDDGCSFTFTQQEFENTSPYWRYQDCDGDGVTNGDELDPDGNGINDGNGTDLFDPCSLNLSMQNLPPSAEWWELDCDGDCLTNYSEINSGKDPLVPDTDVNLDKIQVGGEDVYYNFEEEGSQLQAQIMYFDGMPVERTSFEYLNDQLIEVRIRDTWGDIFHGADYTYQNGELIEINRAGDIITVTHEVDKITSTSDTNHTTPGLNETTIEFEPGSDRITRVETYRWQSGADYEFYVFDYTYDATGINVIQRQVVQYEYNSNTEDYTFIESFTESYTYFEDILNPARDAYEKIYIPGILVERPGNYYFKDAFICPYVSGYTFAIPAVISGNLLKSFVTDGFSKQLKSEMCSETLALPSQLGGPYFEARYFVYE